MISKNITRFCKDFTKIENYEFASLDNTKMWDCHHKKEIEENKNREQLISEGKYYNVKPDELIFLIHEEHIKLHHIGAKRSLKTRTRMSNSRKGQENPFYGKHFTEEQRRKISEAVANHWAKKRTLSKYIQ